MRGKAPFWELQTYGLTVWKEEPRRGVFCIPNSPAFLAAEQVWHMLGWIHASFMRDSRGRTFDLAERWSNHDGFVIRSKSRTLSYVTQVCLLEGIVKRMYVETVEAIQRWANSDIREDSVAVSERKREVTLAMEFRNMVAAHTVYGSPRDDDNRSLVSTSLHHLLGFSLPVETLSAAEMTLGGGAYVSVGGETPSRAIPPVNVGRLHGQMKDHYRAWSAMFVSLLQPIHAVTPIEQQSYTIRGRD